MFLSVIGNILLFILKIILFLLLFILVVFGLVLFSPIGYNIYLSRNYEEQEDINARVKCFWLLGIIYIKFIYINNKADFVIKLFGVDFSKIKGIILRLKGSKAREESKKEEAQENIAVGKDKKEDKDVPEKQQEKAAEEMETLDDISLADRSYKESDIAELEAFESNNLTDKGESADKKISKGRQKISPVKWFKSLLSKIKQFRQTLKNIYKAIKDGTSKADNIRKFIFSEITKGAICVVKDNVIKLLKHILPRKVDTELLFGTGDPCLTGEALGIIAVIMAATNKRLNITPDFDRLVLEGYIKAKGRIRIVTVLFIVIKVILSDEWKNFYAEFKKFKEVE